MVISGNTRLIAHLGYPTASFKAPMIYNPWFVDQQGDVKVVPRGVRPEDYAAFIPPLFTMTNIIGALVTMPHKIATCDLVQRLSPTAAIAGAGLGNDVYLLSGSMIPAGKAISTGSSKPCTTPCNERS